MLDLIVEPVSKRSCAAQLHEIELTRSSRIAECINQHLVEYYFLAIGGERFEVGRIVVQTWLCIAQSETSDGVVSRWRSASLSTEAARSRPTKR
jgi:hypothetical protein